MLQLENMFLCLLLIYFGLSSLSLKDGAVVCLALSPTIEGLRCSFYITMYTPSSLPLIPSDQSLSQTTVLPHHQGPSLLQTHSCPSSSYAVSADPALPTSLLRSPQSRSRPHPPSTPRPRTLPHKPSFATIARIMCQASSSSYATAMDPTSHTIFTSITCLARQVSTNSFQKSRQCRRTLLLMFDVDYFNPPSPPSSLLFFSHSQNKDWCYFE